VLLGRMGFRTCFSSLPIELQEFPCCPRQGGVSRAGYEVAADAAGNAFPRGEHDERIALSVEYLQQKRKNCLSGFDRTGVAGCGSSRDEIRAFTIDDHNRRARSEPPKPQKHRATELQSMQVFGVPLDIDNGLCGHRQRCKQDPSEPTRQQDAERALRYGDIDCVLAKKHFLGKSRSQDLLCLQSGSDGDITPRYGKRQVTGKRAANAILPTSECYSLACEVNHGAWRQAPRSRSFDYFEKTLQAERYAKLLGRPNIETDKEFNRARLAALMEKQQKRENCWMLDTIVDSDEADIDSDQSLGLNGQIDSTTSTTASDASCSCIAEGKPNKSSLRKIRGETGDIGEGSQEKARALPLGLRRVVASLGKHNADVLSESVLQDLTLAISASANQIRQSPGANGKGKTSTGSRLRASGRNRRMA
jgi:hypothetical protein